MQVRTATEADVGMLAVFNRQLMQDEGHGKRMRLAVPEERMRVSCGKSIRGTQKLRRLAIIVMEHAAQDVSPCDRAVPRCTG